jgi:hypothetical protein
MVLAKDHEVGFDHDGDNGSTSDVARRPLDYSGRRDCAEDIHHPFCDRRIAGFVVDDGQHLPADTRNIRP